MKLLKMLFFVVAFFATFSFGAEDAFLNKPCSVQEKASGVCLMTSINRINEPRFDEITNECSLLVRKYLKEKHPNAKTASTESVMLSYIGDNMLSTCIQATAYEIMLFYEQNYINSNDTLPMHMRGEITIPLQVQVVMIKSTTTGGTRIIDMLYNGFKDRFMILVAELQGALLIGGVK